MRTVAVAGASVLFLLTALLAAVTIRTTARLQAATTSIAKATESVDRSSDLERTLLMFTREGQLSAVLEPETTTFGLELRTQLSSDLAEARSEAVAPAERRLVERASSRVDRYVEHLGALVSRRLPLREIVAASRPQLDAALASVRELRAFNAAELEEARARQARLGQLAFVAAASTTAVILLLGFALVAIIDRCVVKPLRDSARTIDRFLAGDTNARVDRQRLEEVDRIAQGIDFFLDTIVHQNEMRLAFLGGVAHDLRNPLSTLRLAVESLGRGPWPVEEAKMRAIVSTSTNQINRLTRMINDLLDASRIEAGRLELRLEPQDLRLAVQKIVSEYASVPRQHEISWHLAEDPIFVRADPLRLGQVLENLLNNAVNYSKEAAPIDVTVAKRDGEAVFCVSDQGMGIPPEEQETIFLPFRRGAEASAISSGTGLGLSVSQKIIRAHGGRIEVDSVRGLGSTFRVVLPRLEEASVPHPAPPPDAAPPP